MKWVDYSKEPQQGEIKNAAIIDPKLRSSRILDKKPRAVYRQTNSGRTMGIPRRHL